MNNTISFEHFHRLDENGHLNLSKQDGFSRVSEVVLVPTEQVLLVSVNVPGKRASDWQQALPFVLEEQLSQPVEQLFFTVLHRETVGENAGLTKVAIVEKNTLEKWLEELKAHDLESAQLIPDCFVLPEEGLLAIKQNQRLVVRAGLYDGLAGSQDWIEQLLALENKTLTDIKMSNEKVITETSVSGLSTFSLRQGEYAVKNTNRSLLSLWVLPIILVFAVLAVYLAGFVVQTQSYQAQQLAYKQQTEKLFKQMFPSTKRIVNVRAQTKAKLARMNGSENTAGALSLLKEIDASLSSLVKNKSIDVQSMRWKKQQIILLIEAKDVEILQGLVDTISNRFQASLKLKTLAAQDGKKVTGEIYVSAK